MSEYTHLRADVPKRRMGYKMFLAAVAVVFVVSLVDMIWLDDILFYGVIGAYVLLFLWAFILLFSRTNTTQVNMGEVLLACPNCSNAFVYGSTHLKDPAGTKISCPTCAQVSTLPEAGREPKPVHVPEGDATTTTYECGNCDEHIAVGTFGRAPRAVQFQSCPNCHAAGTLVPRQVEAERVRKTGWTN